MRGKRGDPNRWDVPEQKHKDIHKGKGGGAYNERFKQKLDQLGREPTVDDVRRIRDEVAEEFDIAKYRP